MSSKLDEKAQPREWGLAEEMAAQAERADRLSHVEGAQNSLLAQLEGSTVTMTLKELTEQVNSLQPIAEIREHTRNRAWRRMLSRKNESEEEEEKF